MELDWRLRGAVMRPLVSENRVSCAYGHESSELVSWQRDHFEVSVAGTACCAVWWCPLSRWVLFLACVHSLRHLAGAVFAAVVVRCKV